MLTAQEEVDDGGDVIDIEAVIGVQVSGSKADGIGVACQKGVDQDGHVIDVHLAVTIDIARGWHGLNHGKVFPAIGLPVGLDGIGMDKEHGTIAVDKRG